MKETEKKSIIELLDSMLRGNPVELCGVLASTNLLVLETLDRLEYSAVRNASIRTYLTCDNSEMEYLLNDFDALVVLAKDTPEFFARKLHSYCEKMAERIRTEDGCIDALLQLASKLQELRRIEKTDAVKAEVIAVYAGLVLHTLDYLRDDISDDGQVIIGASTDGKPITADNPFAYFSVAEWESVVLSVDSDTPDLTPFVKQGIIHTECSDVPGAVNALLRKKRVFTNLRCALLPYINESTCGLFPSRMAYNDGGDLAELTLNLDIDALDKKLATARKASFPPCGVRVTFNDPTRTLLCLQLQEIPIDDYVCVVYRLRLHAGDFSGYYVPGHDDCYYMGMDYEGDDNRYTIIKKLVMFFYAVAVLDDAEYTDAGFEKVFFNMFYTVSAHSERDMSQHFYVLTAGGKAKRKDGQVGHRMMWREPLQIADMRGFNYDVP